MYFLSSVCFYSQSPMSAGGVADFDSKFNEMMGTLDEHRHAKLAEDLDRWIYDQALGLFTYQRIRTYGIREGIDFKPQLVGMLNLREVTKRP
jgi:hypothetical protein